ncbi:MAG: alpha/beta hydrolase-fold protein [Bacteroidales bacterium]
MKKLLNFISLLVILLPFTKAWGQVFVRISEMPENNTTTNKIYIAGNFNGWNPCNPEYELKKDSTGMYYLKFITRLKEIEYKFTLGSWEKVECNENGTNISNRKSELSGSDTIFVKIQAWSNNIKRHTAGKNVQILDSAFYMPQLNKKRRIWIYLPPDYNTSQKKYPVYYAHDGQNLFDAATSFAGEWEVDEILDSLAVSGKTVPIVVGIDNGGSERINELTPWSHHKYGGGKADLYCDFIVKTLKPHIDSVFRTKPDKPNTGVFGSSLGGLVSMYMVLKYPETFSKSGVFSPAFWIAGNIYKMADNKVVKKISKLYIIGGSRESETLQTEISKMQNILEMKGMSEKNLKVEIITDGEHKEWFWRREFPKVIEWLNE